LTNALYKNCIRELIMQYPRSKLRGIFFIRP
jgi:hypothetical protein